jgi:hypothetical protein
MSKKLRGLLYRHFRQPHCTHEAELFVCDICGEDFAKYIVSRNYNVSDVSMTQDVLTGVETPKSIEKRANERA